MTPGARSLYVRPPLGTLADDPTALPAILSGAASHGAQVGTLPPLQPSGARDDPQAGPPSRRTIPVDGEDSPSATEEGASDKSKAGGWWGGEAMLSHSAVSGSLFQPPILGRSREGPSGKGTPQPLRPRNAPHVKARVWALPGSADSHRAPPAGPLEP